MAEEFFENVRIPFIVQKYEDKAIVIPKELYMDFSTGKMYVKSIDGATEIEVGRKTIENTIKVEIEKLIGKSTSNGNTLRKLQNIVEPLKLWKDQMDSIGYLSVSTIAEILEVFKDMEETAPTLFAQLQYKVDKVQGLELSDNDFTNELFNKLMSIEKEANLYTHPEVQACNYVAPISLVNGRTGDVVITKEELGLGNVQAGAKKYVHPRDKQCAAVSIDSVQIGGDTPKTGIVTLNKASFYLDKVVNNTLITEAEIAATTDGNLPANKYCTPHTFNLYLQKLKALGKFDETQYKYVPKTVSLTINTTPSDATAKVMYDNAVHNGKTHTLKSKTGYMVVVEKAGYYKYEKYHYLNSDTDVTINVTLQEIVYNYTFKLNHGAFSDPHYLTIKNASNQVVDTKTLTNSGYANIPSYTVTDKLKPGTYTYTVTGTQDGSIPTYTPSGSFTITNQDITVTAITYGTIGFGFNDSNDSTVFYKDGTKLSFGELNRILIYVTPSTKYPNGYWKLLNRGVWVYYNKPGHKYAYIPTKYIYTDSTNRVAITDENLAKALVDKETIIKDIDTTPSNTVLSPTTPDVYFKNRIDIPADPCNIITHGSADSFGLFNNGTCTTLPVELKNMKYTDLYTLLGFTLSENSSGYYYSPWHFTRLQLFKAILNNRIIYINYYSPLTKVSYNQLANRGLTSPYGKTVVYNGKSFTVKMFTGAAESSGWTAGGDISKIIPVLQEVSALAPANPAPWEGAAWWYKDYLNRTNIGSSIICRDDIFYDTWDGNGNYNRLAVQRCGIHGLHALPKPTTIDPYVAGTGPNTERPLADMDYRFSTMAGFWFYIEF